MNDTVNLIVVDEDSPRYCDFLNLQRSLISLGAKHDPQTLAQFVLYLLKKCEPHPSVHQDAFLIALIAVWNKYRSLDVLSSHEKFYTTGAY